jgi:hypothetical protein
MNYSLQFIGPILKGDVAEVDFKHEAEVKFAKDLQAALKTKVWNTGGCQNWYQTESGWNSTVYPYVAVYDSYRYNN